jgi:hypothetical protein
MTTSLTALNPMPLWQARRHIRLRLITLKSDRQYLQKVAQLNVDDLKIQKINLENVREVRV